MFRSFSIIFFILGIIVIPFSLNSSYLINLRYLLFILLLTFGIGIVFCLPFYVIDTEGDLKGLLLRVFRPSTESTTNPINEKIRAYEEPTVPKKNSRLLNR